MNYPYTRLMPRTADSSPYRQWERAQGVPIYEGSFIQQLGTLAVEPWTRIGQRGAFVNLAGQEEDDAWIIEIEPAGSTAIQHHLCEALAYVVDGRGATTFWQAGAERQTVEWQQGSLFSPPLNCYYQHFNLDGQEPARLFVVTNTPMLLNIFRNADFIFGTDYAFTERYEGEEDYFTGGRFLGVKDWKTNFIPDVRTFKLADQAERGFGSKVMHFGLANNSFDSHCSEFPPGTYKKAHRHGPGAHVMILDGIGYSLLWFEGEEPRRVDWSHGTVFSPREMEFHQHFNTGPTGARYLAVTLGGLHRGTSRWERREEGIEGIPYEREDPAVYELYESECAKNGVAVKLPRPVRATR